MRAENYCAAIIKLKGPRSCSFYFFFLSCWRIEGSSHWSGQKNNELEKKKDSIKKKKGRRNCRVFRRVSCLMRTIFPERHRPRLPDITPLWRHRVGSWPMSWATKDPSSSLTRGVVSFHSRLTARSHVRVAGRGEAEHTRGEGEEREAGNLQEMQPGRKPRERELSA